METNINSNFSEKLRLNARKENRASGVNKTKSSLKSVQSSCSYRTESRNSQSRRLSVLPSFERRCSLRIQNKKNVKTKILKVLNNILSKKMRRATLNEKCQENVSKKLSNDSVIYVATYHPGSEKNIPIIDLTESNGSINQYFSNHSILEEKQNHPKREFNKRKPKPCARSLSFASLMRTNSVGRVPLISEKFSVKNHKDSKIIMNNIVSSEKVWELKKSYPLTKRLQQKENIQSYHPLSKSRTYLKQHSNKIIVRNHENCQKCIPNRSTASEPTLPNDLKDIKLYPLLTDTLKNVDLDSLSKLYGGFDGLN